MSLEVTHAPEGGGQMDRGTDSQADGHTHKVKSMRVVFFNQRELHNFKYLVKNSPRKGIFTL